MSLRAVIIGAGISGLALGWYLKQTFGDAIDLKILEAGDRCGGWIRTDLDRGFLFESGPRSCRTRGAGLETLELIESLGIGHEVIAASSDAKKRYLFIDGKLQAFPDGIRSFFTSPLMKGVLPALWNEMWCRRGIHDDETVADFFNRRLSPAITNRLIDPLISGIYAGDIGSLSVRSCFPDAFRLEREHGSLLRGMFMRKRERVEKSPFVQRMSREPIFSFRNGMETLTRALQKALNQHICYASGAEKVLSKESGLQVLLKDGSHCPADHIFLTLPSKGASKVVKTLSPDASLLMEEIPSASVAVVNLGWDSCVLHRKGFGYLIPHSEKEDILGVVWDSSAFPQQNNHPDQTRLTVMLGGSRRPEICGYSSGRLLEISLNALRRQLGIELSPDVIRVTYANESIPQYHLGHATRVKKIKEALMKDVNNRVHLVGSPWKGVAVNDCIAEAKKTAAELNAYLAYNK